MISSRSMVSTSVLLATVAIGMLHTNCRSSNQAFVQYQRPAHAYKSPAESSIVSSPDTLPTIPASEKPSLVVNNQLIFNQATILPAHHPTPMHVRNPEARESKRKGWLHKISLNADYATTDYAPQHEAPVLSTKRKVPGTVKVSLAGAIVSQGLLLLGTATGAVWLLTILLPLASVLLGVAGLAKISHRREDYRGKGWAMSAIMLATGALGLALVAAAALATSEAIWK